MMFSIPGTGEAPFSISSTPSRPGLLEFCIRKVGKLTDALFKLKENDIIGIRGPYGNGFPIEKMTENNILIIMGGLGVAPLRSLLLYCLDNRRNFRKIYLLYGTRNPTAMLFKKEFFEFTRRDDLECLLTVDNDKTGRWPYYTGYVTNLFNKIEKVDAK